MTTIAMRVQRSRRPRRCDSCSGPIAAGERYRYWVGTVDRTFYDARECARCCDRYGRPIEAPPEKAT